MKKIFSLGVLAKTTLAALVELTTENPPKDLLNDHQFAVVVYHEGMASEDDGKIL